MYVCLCNGVTESQIRREAERGCRTPEELTMRTGCGASCGCCREEAAQSLRLAQAQLDALARIPRAA
jgi:bacterioferritin-associated ferredoxin